MDKGAMGNAVTHLWSHGLKSLIGFHFIYDWNIRGQTTLPALTFFMEGTWSFKITEEKCLKCTHNSPTWSFDVDIEPTDEMHRFLDNRRVLNLPQQWSSGKTKTHTYHFWQELINQIVIVSDFWLFHFSTFPFRAVPVLAPLCQPCCITLCHK